MLSLSVSRRGFTDKLFILNNLSGRRRGFPDKLYFQSIVPRNRNGWGNKCTQMMETSRNAEHECSKQHCLFTSYTVTYDTRRSDSGYRPDKSTAHIPSELNGIKSELRSDNRCRSGNHCSIISEVFFFHIKFSFTLANIWLVHIFQPTAKSGTVLSGHGNSTSIYRL